VIPYLAVSLCIAICIEIALIVHIEKTAGRVQECMTVSLGTVNRKGVSDHWKEKLLLYYAGRMFAASLKLGGLIFLIFTPALLLYYLGGRLDPAIPPFFISPKGLIFSTVLSVAYLPIRLAFRSSGKENQDYSASSRLLHHLALGPRIIREASFDVEQASVKCKPDDQRGHVFVSGLARAGTTLLMRLLYESGDFCSLTYRDMPFVLAPNLWKKLSAGSRKDMEKKERAHKDGVLVDFDSPEALEEVFWKTFCAEKYLHSDHLSPMQADKETVEKFRAYIASILCAHENAEGRYLSKNNNNILRLDAVRESFPNAVILIPFRHPLTHAASLMNQHRLFLKSQKQDAFALKYMIWLAHHEFGGGHRPFRFSEEAQAKGAPLALDYWLRLWIDAYGFLYPKSNDVNARLVCYEDLCKNPATALENLGKMAKITQPMGRQNPIRSGVRKVLDPYDPVLLANAESLYLQLREKGSWLTQAL
jgi:hypothetical protein